MDLYTLTKTNTKRQYDHQDSIVKKKKNHIE